MRMPRTKKNEQPAAPTAKDSQKHTRAESLRILTHRIMTEIATDQKSYNYPVQPVTLPPGVVPAGLAMDSLPIMGGSDIWGYLNSNYPGGGFPGYPYLSSLATRAEYRAFASAVSTELTRKWIEVVSTSGDDSQNDRIEAINTLFHDMKVRGTFQRAAEHDVLFGRGQIFVDVDGADRARPLILDPRTVRKGSFKRICAVEANWTTPKTYNSLDPTAPDFFKPSVWFMLGVEVHASRLQTIITRPVPDLLKAAFNFGGLSLSQLAEPYVDNWLRTRQSIADLVNNFSITALKTNMEQGLVAGEPGDIFDRVKLFTDMRSNKGMMVLNNTDEDLVQMNVPLSGLGELQSQALEHLCTASRIPAMVLTGISPTGMNASSEGEMQAWNNWISAQQEAYWREPLEVILKLAQLSLFGEIDPHITFNFVPLAQPSPKEIAEINEIQERVDVAYIGAGVLAPEEVREHLAHDVDSGYQGLDLDVVPVEPNADPEGWQQEPDGAEDKSVSEAQHKAMEAAAHGKSTLGIPKGVGEEFVKKDDEA